MTKFHTLALAFIVMLPVVLPADAAGLPVAKRTMTIKNKDIDVSIQYPQTGNRAIDGVLLAYARNGMGQFKEAANDRLESEAAYTLETTYVVERNDDKMFAVVFTEYSDMGGAHPNSEFATFNFLLPDGSQIFLPEIVDGSRGIKRISTLAISDLVKTLGAGSEPLSDEEWIKRGAGPLAVNFKDFVWLPSKLHLYFPPYQVASHADGPQEVNIPLTALSGVIRSNWRAPAPSFDCRSAASGIEKAICADAAVARLDRQVAETYWSKLNNASGAADREKLKQSQRDWIASRNSRCGGTTPGPCLTKFYQDRLVFLKNPPG